ncbi:hypothetical protein TWF730_008898 [Orbilia blumenaviensis]|uniref:Uncharacterized protein n=1 Tax=Orbilia blumenaviensis TaxID=1796055 RepID=A0AAV9V3E0_9PEZI
MSDNRPQATTGKRDRSFSDVVSVEASLPPNKKTVLSESQDETATSRAIESIRDNPIATYAAGPTSLQALSSDPVPVFSSDPIQPSLHSDAFSLDLPSSPPVLEPQFLHSQSSSLSNLDSSPPEFAKFEEVPVDLPLDIKGDLSVPAGPDRPIEHVTKWGRYVCAEIHPEATAVLAFENPNDINSTILEAQILNREFKRDEDFLEKVESFAEFLRDKVASCAVCQLAGREANHHLPNCSHAQADVLGTFIWDEEFGARDSDVLEQAVLVLCAVVRLVAPHLLTDIAIWMNEDIPGSYLNYKSWCLLPDSFLGAPALKGYRVVLALKTLLEDGLVEL